MSDSYVTYQEAEAYFDGNPNVDDFFEGDTEWFLSDATRIIDALPLRGQRYESEYIYNGTQKDINLDGIAQVLEFPRFIDGVCCDWDQGTNLPIVPSRIKAATCILANQLFEDLDDGDSPISEKELQERGISSFTLGKLSMSFSPGAFSKYYGLPKAAFDLMRIYIEQNPIVL